MIHPAEWHKQIWYTLGNGADRNDTPWEMVQTEMIHPKNGADRNDTPWEILGQSQWGISDTTDGYHDTK